MGYIVCLFGGEGGGKSNIAFAIIIIIVIVIVIVIHLTPPLAAGHAQERSLYLNDLTNILGDIAELAVTVTTIINHSERKKIQTKTNKKTNTQMNNQDHTKTTRTQIHRTPRVCV